MDDLNPAWMRLVAYTVCDWGCRTIRKTPFLRNASGAHLVLIGDIERALSNHPILDHAAINGQPGKTVRPYHDELNFATSFRLGAPLDFAIGKR